MPDPKTCPMCQRTIGAIPHQPVTDQPAVLEAVLEALHARRAEVEAGRRTPEEIQAALPEACPMCRGLRSGITGSARRQELLQHLDLEIRRVEARIEAMAQNRAPSAEHRPRRRGPGDRAA
jgi:hypothetical protein